MDACVSVLVVERRLSQRERDIELAVAVDELPRLTIFDPARRRSVNTAMRSVPKRR
jgi:hypothetical protein